jgi:hypothetical protein
MNTHAQLLAAFVSPALATAGVAAVAAPILIHLLARRRFKRIRWAAMDFLIDAERRNRRRVRLEELILLALRCLAVLFVGLMVARPFLSAGGVASAWGGSRRTERILVLDDSFSMGYESADGTSFSRAKSAVRRLVESFRRDTPDDAVTILRMSSPTSPVVAGAYLDPERVEETLARVEALSPSQQSIELGDVFKGLAEVLSRDAGTVSAAVYVISDFQRRDWAPRESPQGTAADGAMTAPLRAWAGKDRGLRVLLINVGQADAANLAVVGLDLQGGQPVAGTTASVRAIVANFSRRPAENLQLSVEVGLRPSRRAGTKMLPSLGEFQQASVDVEAEFLRAGDESVRVEIPRDALPIDNVRYAAVDVVSAIRVLIVNGEPSADEYEDEVALLRTALRPEGEVFSGQEVVVVDEAGLETANLSGYHAVILANVYRVSAPAVEALERFVRAGGGLMVFLGDQVDAQSYNAEMFREGEGLLPVELGETIRPTEPSRLVIADRLHPALRALGGADDPLGIGQIAFFGRVGIAHPAAGSARVVARFGDADEHPAIVERAFGAGRVLLIATSADKEWNAWPDHPTYLPIMTELLRHISRGGGGEVDRWVGSRIEFPLDPALFESDVIVRAPGYPNEPEATATAVPAEDGTGLQIRWEHAGSAGVYQFALRRRDGGETIRLAAVNVDPTESDLTMAADEVLGRTMGGVPFEYVRGLDQLAGAAGEARTELWTPLLLAAMAALMAEQSLAWWWGRKR